MNKVLMVLVTLLLAGCDPESSTVTNDFVLPPKLKDCQIYKLVNSQGDDLFVVDCPMSVSTITSVSGGDDGNSTTVVTTTNKHRRH